jgi:hypothetical protein
MKRTTMTIHLNFLQNGLYNMANEGKDEGTSIYGVYQVMSEIGVATMG